jgi:rhodanese-related sulfurtransferase
MTTGYAGDISPRDAWKLLCRDAQSVLVDVRTPAEWTYVGVPDMGEIGKKPVLVPWMDFPTMERNDDFVAQVGEQIGRDAPLVLLCRSGVRSRAAAIALTAAGYGPCYNIETGFEGDPNAQRHRGTVSGWKVDGLPWAQT